VSEPTENQLERRTGHGELRVEDARKRRLGGYAIVFNKWSEDLGGFREQIAPDAVNRTLKENIDVRAFFDHDSGKVIGRLTAGTLRVEKDKRGFRVEIDVPDTSVGNDLMVSVERRDITGMSFGFRVAAGGSEWEEDADGNVTRTISDMRVHEVSVVSMPAYPDTSIAVRSLQAFQAERKPSRLEYLKRLHRQRMAG